MFLIPSVLGWDFPLKTFILKSVESKQHLNSWQINFILWIFLVRDLAKERLEDKASLYT